MNTDPTESSENEASSSEPKSSGRAFPLAIAGVGLASVVAAGWFMIKKRRAATLDTDIVEVKEPPDSTADEAAA